MYNGYYYGFDMTYLVLVVPALLIALIAQIQVKSAFSRYARVRCTSGLTGAQAAQRILQANGITDVRIEHISGKLTDHFDPQAKVIRLSDEVYGVASIAAVGVAAHEAGHAVQYATDYAPIRIRAAIIPATRIGSNLSWPLLIAGLIFNWSVLVWAGILLFGLVTVFQLATLPVEFNASRRALAAIESRNLLTDDEQRALLEQLQSVEQYVEMVLGYLRLESPSSDYVIRNYALDDIVRQAVRKYASQFIRRKLRLEYTPLNVSVITDEKWLLFVIEQVLSNALKYTRSGSVSITLEAPKTLCIRDTGIGIAPEDLPRVFEKGFTGCNGRTDKRATGIGLYLCRRILEKLGHTIAITSTVGEGTTVRIGLQQDALEVE